MKDVYKEFLELLHSHAINYACDLLEGFISEKRECFAKMADVLAKVETSFNPQIIVVAEGVRTVLKDIDTMLEILGDLRKMELTKNEEQYLLNMSMISCLQAAFKKCKEDEELTIDTMGDREKFVYVICGEIKKKEVGN